MHVNRKKTALNSCASVPVYDKVKCTW